MNADYLARKERWARKMAGKEVRTPRSGSRLPPGQHEVRDFPVLDLGGRPDVSPATWTLKIHGQVEHPVTLDWPAFQALPRFADTSDFHCVTTWSQFDMEWSGVAFFTLADQVRPKAVASHLFLKCHDGYTTNLELAACLDDDVLVADRWRGEPLPREHGGPARLVVPKRYAWKSAKWLREIIFLDRPLRGYWELRGYSDTADPFTNDRFST